MFLMINLKFTGKMVHECIFLELKNTQVVAKEVWYQNYITFQIKQQRKTVSLILLKKIQLNFVKSFPYLKLNNDLLKKKQNLIFFFF